VGGEASRQGPLQLGELLAHPSAGQMSHGCRIGRAGDQGRKHLAPRLAHDVGGHPGQLDVGALQGLLEPVDLRRSLAHQRCPLAGQFAQLPLVPLRHEASVQQAVPQQIGDPLAIPDVGLPARDGLDVRRVGEQEREIPLEQIPNGLPVDPGGLERDVGHPMVGEPIGEPQEVVGQRLEGADLLDRLSVRSGDALRRRKPNLLSTPQLTTEQHRLVIIQWEYPPTEVIDAMIEGMRQMQEDPSLSEVAVPVIDPTVDI
jgi:hypothetical protein